MDVTSEDGDFNNEVDLTCEGTLPAGTACSFDPASVTPGASGEQSTLTVSTSAADTPAGSTDFTITGTSGTLTDDATATLVAEDFAIAISPDAATVSAGGSGSYTVTVTPDAGAGSFSSAVSFACSGLPSGASCAFSPTTVTPDDAAATTTVTVSTASTVAASSITVTRPDGVPFGSQKLAMLLFALPIFGLTLTAAGKGRGVSALRRCLVIVALIGVGVQFSACDSPSEPPPEPVTTTFTVTASGGGLDRTDTATITVNQ